MGTEEITQFEYQRELPGRGSHTSDSTLLWCSWLFLAGHLWDWLKPQGAQANHWARNQAGGPNFIRWDEGRGPQATQMTSQCFSSGTKVNEMLTPTCLKRLLVRSNWEGQMSNLVDRLRVMVRRNFTYLPLGHNEVERQRNQTSRNKWAYHSGMWTSAIWPEVMILS